MNSLRRQMALVLAAGAVTFGARAALAADPSQQELQAQIQQLQTKVAALESNQAQSKDVDATVEALLRDADRRSQLMQVEGFTAGYDSSRGFVIRDPAGDFLLHPYFQFQPRYVANWREDGKGDDRDTTEDGFEIRRMKMGFDGNMFTPDLTYKFQWATDRANVTQTVTDQAGESSLDTISGGGTLRLEDAWARYKFADFWAVRGGQLKDPVFHESLVGSDRQLAADRSLLNEVVGGGESYIQGVSLIWDNDTLAMGPMRAEWAFHDGWNDRNTGFQDVVWNWGTSGRAEWMLQGKAWKPYSDFSALSNKDDLLVVGAGADLSQSGDLDVLWHTADVQWEPQALRGFAAYAAYDARWVDSGSGSVPGGTDDSSYDWGFVVQGGYMITSQWELYARYDYIALDENGSFASAAAVQDAINEITVGANYFIKGHAAKFTMDLTYLPGGSPISSTGIGVLSQTTDDAQLVGRVQFQLLL